MGGLDASQSRYDDDSRHRYQDPDGSVTVIEYCDNHDTDFVDTKCVEKNE